MPTKQERLDTCQSRLDAAIAKRANADANYARDSVKEALDKKIVRITRRRNKLQALV